MRQIDLAYIRENDWTSEQWRARIANAYGDATRTQNLTYPVVMPQVEASVAYQSSVFLTGNPIFGVVSEPTFEDEALQMETVIWENSVRGAWVRELMMFIRDGEKYNLAALEVVWDRKTVASFETDIKFSATQGKPKDTIWQGNCLKRWDLYNTFFDTRCSPTHLPQEGEFIGNTQIMSRMRLKQFIQELPDKMVENITEAFESGIAGIGGSFSGAGTQTYYLPMINPLPLYNKNMYATIDWMAWAGVSGAADNAKINYKNLYQVTTLYARILPSDMGIKVPQANTPQVWKFILVNFQVVIYAERQTNAHNLLPVLIAQPNEDGLEFQTKSTASNVQPFQEISSSLINSVLASRRRGISDRGIYDPSRIDARHINSPNPSAKIPVRPSAYGKDVREAYHPIPFDDTFSSQAISEIQVLSGAADIVSGRNKAQQGQFVKGNKTLHEYSDVMSHANGRDQMKALLLEDQIFTPLKEILKSNILQYQQAGTYYNAEKKKPVDIDPVALRKAVLTFKVSDGLVPTEKLIRGDTAQVAFQVIGSSPQLQSKYDVGGLFTYLMKTQGAPISEFEKPKEQLAYEQAVQAWGAAYAKLLESITVISKAAAEEPFDVLLQKLSKMLPPQPQPAQFGWNPNPQAQQPAQESTPA